MADPVSIALVAGLVLAAVGTGVTIVASRKQAKAQKKSAKEQQKLAALAAARARRKVIREARVRRGAALNIAGQVGAGESSGLRGGLSGLSSQAGREVGDIGIAEGIGRKITKFGIQASNAASLGAIGGGLTALGGAVFSNADVFKSLGRDSAAPEFAPRPVPRPA